MTTTMKTSPQSPDDVMLKHGGAKSVEENDTDPDALIARSREKGLSREEAEAFGVKKEAAPRIRPTVSFIDLGGRKKKKIVPIIGIKGSF